MPGYDPTAMDKAAVEANLELVDLDTDSLLVAARWLRKWYLKAGYKRLCRQLLELAREVD